MSIPRINRIQTLRNIELSKQIEELKAELGKVRKTKNNFSDDEKKLLDDLEQIKVRWIKAVEEIEQKKMEYEELICQIKSVRDTMVKKK